MRLLKPFLELSTPKPCGKMNPIPTEKPHPDYQNSGWLVDVWGDTTLWYTWNPKQPFINGCFNWMIPNLYIGNSCFTKHLFINGCLGFQVAIIMIYCLKSRWLLLFSSLKQYSNEQQQEFWILLTSTTTQLCFSMSIQTDLPPTVWPSERAQVMQSGDLLKLTCTDDWIYMDIHGGGLLKCWIPKTSKA